MKQIFEGEVYEILPISNGIMFSYCKDIVDERINVSYKMISFDDGRITDITKNVFLGEKYGTNYQEIIKRCEHYITDRAITLPSGKILIASKNGVLKLIDTDAQICWQGNLNYRSFNASDVVIYKNSLWACFKDCDILLRYNLSTMREELRIGGNKSPFKKPRSLFLDGEEVFVCNVGSKKITKVNLESYAVTDEFEFEEEVLQYLKTDIYRFVILRSGLYLVRTSG